MPAFRSHGTLKLIASTMQEPQSRDCALSQIGNESQLDVAGDRLWAALAIHLYELGKPGADAFEPLEAVPGRRHNRFTDPRIRGGDDMRIPLTQ